MALTSPTPGRLCVTVINKFVVPPNAMDEFIAEFEQHRTILAAHSGFSHGALYKKEAGSGRFNVVNVAVWESANALEAARNTMRDQYAERGSRPDSRYGDLGVEVDMANYMTLLEY